MASTLPLTPIHVTLSPVKLYLRYKLPHPRTHFPSPKNNRFYPQSQSVISFRLFPSFNQPKFNVTRSSADDILKKIENEESNLVSEGQPVKFILWVLLWATVSIGVFALSGDDAKAAVIAAAGSIRTSGFGLKVANALRASGWADELVVFSLATLPVIELRGAIPVGYWLQLKPVMLTVLSIIGNMVPVPFIILYLKKVATYLALKNPTASRFLDMLFKSAKSKAGPVEEFQWLGLMLFVAVPFPGTGAWTGAIIASILDMPFWTGVSANCVGVVLASLLVNLLVNLGIKYAILTGLLMFVISTFMWTMLRGLKKSLAESN